MAVIAPFNLKKWIDEHRDLLKPPVGNQCIYKDAENFIVMVVGGPNARKDYHYNESEELYYQVEGNIVLKIIDDGVPKSIPINEGDLFLLPPQTPHSPQRGANTVGLVIEKVREDEEDEKDAFMWFCENCGAPQFSQNHIKASFSSSSSSRTFSITSPTVLAPRCGECGVCGGRRKRSPSLIGIDLGTPSSMIFKTIFPSTW